MQADTVEARGQQDQGAERFVLILERTKRGPTWFDFNVSLKPTDRGGFLGDVEAQVKAGRVIDVIFGSAYFFGGTDEPEMHAFRRSISSCDVGVCDVFVLKVLTAGYDYRDKRGGDPFNRLFVAVWGKDVNLKLEADGWVLRRVDWDVRFVEGTRSDAIGFETGGEMGAEVFMNASERGGRFGSFGVAVAPCATTGLNVPPRGVGQATLDGGVERKTVTCPSDGDPLVLPSSPESMTATWAPRATEWRFHGTVVGDTSLARARLFVLDFPRGFLRR